MSANAEPVASLNAAAATPPDERTKLLPSRGAAAGGGGGGAASGKRRGNSGQDATCIAEPRTPESDGGTPPQYRRRHHHHHHHHHHLPALIESLTLPTVTPVNFIASPCTFLPESDTESEQGGSQSQAAQKKLLIVTILALVFFVMELVGGYYANSLALMSDSFHLLSDVAGFVISLTAIYLSSQPATKRHSFGFHRAEVLGALLSIALIYGMTGVLVWEAIDRLKNPQPIDARTMLVISSLGVAVNMILAITLGHDHHHGHAHGHAHDHDHHDEHDVHEDNHTHDPENGGLARHSHGHDGNINIRAAAIHVIGDLIASVGVLISSIIILLSPETAWVDPMCTLIFAFLVLVTTFRIVVDSIQVLMEGTPGHIDPSVVQASLNRVPGVIKVHDLHVWNLTTGKTSLTAHLILSSLDPSTGCQLQPDSYNRVIESAQSLLKSQFGVVHSTLQIRLVHSPCVARAEGGTAVSCSPRCESACDERCAER